MLKLKCRECAVVLTEAERRWVSVASTGRCPECGSFYDEQKEIEAHRLASDLEVVARTRKTKIREITMGTVITAAAIGGLVLSVLVWKESGILVICGALAVALAFGFRMFIHGLLYNPLTDARTKIARQTNLSSLAQRQQSEGVFSDSE